MGATAGSRASEAGFKRQICTTSEFIKSARTVRAVNKFPGCAAFSYVQIIVTDDRAMPLLGQDILSTSASVNLDYTNLRLDLRGLIWSSTPPCSPATRNIRIVGGQVINSSLQDRRHNRSKLACRRRPS